MSHQPPISAPLTLFCQNNLAELWSLLNFLLPDIFDDLESFQVSNHACVHGCIACHACSPQLHITVTFGCILLSALNPGHMLLLKTSPHAAVVCAALV